jgi:predicted TPR repeat methyltransferase
VTGRGFLDRVYGLDGAEATRAFYSAWAASYDAEIAANGYATPRRCAAALARLVPDRSLPVIDIGCGTGLSGLALRAAGFTTVDGTDLTPDMLDLARARGLYRRLALADANALTPFAPGTYAHAAAIGVFGPGHAAPELVDAAVAALPANGCFVFAFNDHTLADPSYESGVEALLTGRVADLVYHAKGPHLPGIGVEAIVYVLRKR